MLWLSGITFRKIGLCVILSCLTLHAYVCREIDTGPKIENAYIVNNEGCKMIALDVTSPEIEGYMGKPSGEYGCIDPSWLGTQLFNESSYLEFIYDVDQILIDHDLDDQTKIQREYARFDWKGDWQLEHYRTVTFHLVAPYRWKL